MIAAFRFEEKGLSPQEPGKLFTKEESLGEGVRPHYHASLEINILEGLRGSVRIEGEQFPLEGKKVLFIPPGTVHSYDILPGSYRIHILHLAFRMMRNWINPDTLEDLLHESSPVCLGDEAAVTTGLKQLIQPQEPLIRLNPITSSQLLFFLLPFFSQGEQCGFVQLQRREQERLRRLIDYAEEHFASSIPVETAAQICGMSRSSFCRFFPGATGSSWNRYLTDLRLDTALKLLQQGLTVTETALACGFFDSSHFSRHFRQRFGVNPGKFKR